jgi:hypothetical protein
MSSPETASVARSSLARDWLYALRYWLRGRRGAAVLVVSVVAIGAALNWSWLVAVGIAPLLLTALPCIAMCGLGLCMNRMTGGSCSTSSSGSDGAGLPTQNTVQRLAASERVEGASVSQTPTAGTVPDHPTVGAAAPAPDQQPHVLKERE